MSPPTHNIALPKTIAVRDEGKSWSECIAGYTIFVEESDSDVGNYRSRTTQWAYACQDGSAERLYSHESSTTSGHLLRKGSTPTGSLCSRDAVFSWLLANVPAVSSAYDELLRKAEEVQRQAADEAANAFEAEVLRCVGGCPFEYLASKTQGFLGSDRLAPLLKMTTRALNAWLLSADFQRREGSRWVPCRTELCHSNFGSQVGWTALGLKTIWDAALAEGLTKEPPAALLGMLRKQLHWLPEWRVLDEAARRRP